MKRFGLVAALGLLAVLATASAAPAATIQEVLATQFNPTQYDFYTSGYGHSGYWLTWNNVDPLTHQFLSGHAARDFSTVNNPSSLNFATITSGGNGGTPTDTGTLSPTVSLYRMGVNTGQAWSMDLSMLFYDPDFGGNGVLVELAGSVSGTANYKYHNLSAADVDGGTMIKYHIAGAAGETVDIQVTAYGDETYPAGFFMDNYVPGGDNTYVWTPEPATLTLMLAGAVGMVLRRRRR
jgi:hypothetical protein